MNDAYVFGFYFIAFIIYGTMPILFIGLPFSLLIELLMDRIRIASMHKIAVILIYVMVYAAAGFVGTWVYFFVLADGKFELYLIRDTWPFSLLGIYAALLFLLLRFFVDWIFKKRDS
jgi:hypothetical protein